MEEFIAVSDGESSYVPSPYRMSSLPSGSRHRGLNNMGSPSKHITVVDVYDLAASIGKDFEKLIQLYGNDCVRGIMPKVISALETLEALANNNERENEEIITLQKTLERFESEKLAKKMDRIKFEEELEQVEDNYRKEINELRGMVKTLMAENRSLTSTVQSLPTTMDSPLMGREEEMESFIELKEASQKQKEEIKHLKNDVEMYMNEVENMQNGIDRLIRQNEELLRKNASLQKQGRMIIEEKMDLMKRLDKTEEANIQLMQTLNEKDRFVRDLEQANMCENEPRFTLAELREVLQEKNLLKGKVMELEEQLTQLRPSNNGTEEDYEHNAEEDRPVQGPLPREPTDKLNPWKFERKESGVRRFFSFFKDLGAPSSPRRGSSATSSPRPVRSITMSQLT